MELDISKDSLLVYEVLASETRLKIIKLLGKEKRNISEIASALQLSNAIITRHIQKMEAANLIKSEKIPGKSGIQKLVFLSVDDIHIRFPEKIYHAFNLHKTDLKLGHFTNFDVSPTCGLATTNNIVGKPDDPKYFMESDRVNASLLWFSKGFVEYKIPNLLQDNQHAEMLEISFELSSEFPLSNNVWPSDISIYINDIKIGVYTVPGNFSDTRGRYTPTWWNNQFSQYGLLKHLRINSLDSGMDGEPFSAVTINDLKLDQHSLITLKFAVESDSSNVGGLTLFGKGFGNHDQDILVNLYYIDN